MKKLLVLLALVPTLCFAKNDFYTGNSLLDKLTDDSPQWRMLGLGYVVGVYAAQSETLCVPMSVSAGQLKDVAEAFLKNTPELRHLAAADLVWMALMKAWPCANTKRL